MENLKKLRISRHLSQQKLAEKFNLSQQSIYKYENNLAEPDLLTLKKFASFFHTSVDYLINFTPEEENLVQTELPSDESHLLFLYRSLSASMQAHITGIMEEFVEKK